MFRKSSLRLALISLPLLMSSAFAGDWYTASGVPSTGSQGSSAAMRGEFNLINTAMDKLPTVTANGSKGVFVNSGGTALESVTAAAARTNLGLVLGTDAQAWDDDLDDLAALVPTDSNFIVGDGTDWVAESGATARTSLGAAASGANSDITSLGSISTVDINGGTVDGATIGGSTPAAATVTTFTSTGIDDNATSTAITIDANKNVSIGIVSSAVRLGLYEAGAATKPLHVFAGSNDAGTKTSITLGSFTTGTGGSEIRSETYHSGNTQSTLEFLTTGAERMRIDASGNVGIGTPTPKVPLSVVEGAVNNSYPTLGVASGLLGLSNVNNAHGLLAGVRQDTGNSWMQAQRTDGTATAYDLVLQPSGGAVTISNADITGGSVVGITDLAVADGGTGASTAAGALTNLGLTATATELNLNDGAVLRHKVIDIGDWDMDATDLVAFSHGLTASKIRSVSAVILKDGTTDFYDFDAISTAGTDSSYIFINPTNVNLNRSAGGFFDNANHDSTSFNRGWVTIWYIN